MTRARSALLVLALGAAPLGAGCDDKKPPPDVALADAGTVKYATADPKLANALRAAASSTASSKDGPPPDGIFPPGEADRRHPAGAPTTLDLVSEGSEPRIDLAAGADASDGWAGTYGPAALETMVQMGPRNAIVLDFALALGPAKKDDGGPGWLVGDIKRVAPADRQLGQLPPGTDRDLASLDGSAIRLKMTADGRESAVDVRAAKSARPDLDRFAMDAAEDLLLSTVPLPAKPVGAGAQWIAETRMPLSGLDVVAYRAYHVKSIDGDRAQIGLSVKAYAASTDVKLEGVPKGATLVQFDAEAQGDLDVARGEPLARSADLQQRVVMIFQPPGAAAPSPGAQAPGNVLTAELQSQTKLVRGGDLRVTAK